MRNFCKKDEKFLVFIFIIILVISIPNVVKAAPFSIFEFNSSGSLINKFGMTAEQEYIPSVDLGPDNNIYISRADTSHSSGIPNPNDQVQVYDPHGNFIRSIDSDTMRHPYALSFDTSWNIYVSGEDDYFNEGIYKYDYNGNFLGSFGNMGLAVDDYNDILVINDLIYASGWGGSGSSDQMRVFNTSGSLINSFSPTGPYYFHRNMAYNQSSDSLFVYTPKNGPGDDLIRNFSLNGTLLGTINVNNMLGGDFYLRGLEFGNDGNLYAFNSVTESLIGFDINGTLLSSLYLGTGWTTDFTFGDNGNILVAGNANIEPVPVPATILLFGFGLIGLLGVKRKKWSIHERG